MTAAKYFLMTIAASIFISDASIAQSRRSQIGESVLVKMRRSYPCRANSIEIRAATDPNPKDACVLVMAVRHAIALGKASRLGVSPTDSTSIIGAEVLSMRYHEVKKPHRVNGAYWMIELTFAGKLPRLEAGIDQFSGRIGIRPYGV